MSKYLCDLIICLYNSGRNDFYYRLKSTRHCLMNIPSNVNVIVLEQITDRTETFIDNLNIESKNINYIKKELPDPFNKSWLYNVGVKQYSKTNNIILGESDVVFKSLYFKYFLEYVKNNNLKWAIGWNTVYYMNANLSDLERDLPGNTSGLAHPKIGRCTGLSVYFNKDFYLKLGGANEWIEGVRGTDNELASKAKNESDLFPIYKSDIYHRYHPRVYDSNNGANHRPMIRYIMINYKESKKIMDKYNDKIGGELPLGRKYKLDLPTYNSPRIIDEEGTKY